MKRTLKEILNSTECPGRFCFFWLEKGSHFAPGLSADLETALDRAIPVLEDGCGCSFGICIRMDPVNGDRDWFEPNEPELEKEGIRVAE